MTQADKDNDKDKTEEKKDEKKSSGGTLSLGGTLTADSLAKRLDKSGDSSSVTVEVKRRRSQTGGSKTADKSEKDAIPKAQKDTTSTIDERRLKALKDSKDEDKDKVWDKTESIKDRIVIDKNRDKPKPPSKPEEPAKPTPAKFKDAPKKPVEERSRDEEESRRSRISKKRSAERRRAGKITVTQALSGDYGERRYKKRKSSSGSSDDDSSNEPQKKIVRDVTIPDFITVQELANRMAEPGGDVVKELMKLGMMVTINQTIEGDTAELIVEEMGHKSNRVSDADVELGLGEDENASDKDLKPRAPVVTVMGHVDHGKTSLLDSIRKADVASGESGGITQHIGAYQITTEKDKKKITFIDTPGHEAFTEMRSRGANLTDIAILVVAADDGIMPQTIESISHAKAAEVPMIVAINKIDLPGADPTRIKTELLQHEVIVEDMSGDVIAVEVSAKEGTNIDKLEEAILLQSEIMELKANPAGVPKGIVVEARMEQGRGNVATVIVQKGTLKVGDIFVAGTEWGKIKALTNDHGKRVKEASLSMPVEITGLNGTPEAGDDFVVVPDEQKAREVTEYRARKKRKAEIAQAAKESTMDKLFAKVKQGDRETLPIIVKADVHGSVEALRTALHKLNEETDDDVEIQIIHTGVGGINESDVSLANTSNAHIIGFNVRANAQARQVSKRDGVTIKYYSVIYNALDDVKAAMQGLLAPEEKEKIIGYAEIRQVFSISSVGNIAGCMVTEGKITRESKLRLLRDDVVVYEGDIDTLKREKDDVKEVKNNFECGISIEKFDDIKVGDVIEAYVIEEVARTL